MKMRLLVHFFVVSNFRRLIHTEAAKTPGIVRHAIDHWMNIFTSENVSEPVHSIHLIMYTALKAKNLVQIQENLDQELSSKERKSVDKFCKLRLARMPMQYIMKEWDFRELKLKMRPPVFIPRPETEDLIDIIKNSCSKNPKRIVEVGCGSGAICISLAKLYKLAEITAIDVSQEACDLTKENCKPYLFCKKLNVINTRLLENGTFENGMQFENIDILVSNPPYIKTEDIMDLEPEIRLYEDMRALDGGKDGMSVIVPLLILASNILRPRGTLFLEVDPSQIDKIEYWLAEHRETGLKLNDKFQDISELDRFVRILKYTSNEDW